MTRRKPDSELKRARPVRRSPEELKLARANGNARPRPTKVESNMSGRERLLRIIDTQATLLRREMVTSDILRWRLLDWGVPVTDLDRPPYMKHPESGKRPPFKPVPRGIKDEGFTPPEPFSVAPADGMTADHFALHVRYRHPGEPEMTKGIHEMLHATRKQTHVHSEPEGARNGKAKSSQR